MTMVTIKNDVYVSEVQETKWNKIVSKWETE